MQNTIELELLQPISGLPNPDGTPGTITKVVLRAPRLREYAQIGDLDSFARTPDGATYMVENEAAFDRYLDALVQQPPSAAILRNIGLADAIRLKEALRDFFTQSLVIAKGDPKTSSSA